MNLEREPPQKWLVDMNQHLNYVLETVPHKNRTTILTNPGSPWVDSSVGIILLTHRQSGRDIGPKMITCCLLKGKIEKPKRRELQNRETHMGGSSFFLRVPRENTNVWFAKIGPP